MAFSVNKTFGPPECWCAPGGGAFYPCKKNKLCKENMVFESRVAMQCNSIRDEYDDEIEVRRNTPGSLEKLSNLKV